MHTLTITPGAERFLAAVEARRRAAQLSTLNAQLPVEEWISTQQAADSTGYSRRHIQTLCEQGFFLEGSEWKQRPPRPGSDQGGRIRILRSALKKLDGAS